MNILEVCRYYKVKGLIYASSSSVYQKQKTPFSEKDVINQPISIYAASKISNELMAYTYNHLYGLKLQVTIFHSVWSMGKPDMFYIF